MFIIFLNDLLEQIIARKLVLKQEHISGYADDLKFIVIGHRQVNKLITFIVKWCSSNGMEVNKKKSAIMKVSKKTQG